jgi:hypothetical protein
MAKFIFEDHQWIPLELDPELDPVALSGTRLFHSCFYVSYALASQNLVTHHVFSSLSRRYGPTIRLRMSGKAAIRNDTRFASLRP